METLSDEVIISRFSHQPFDMINGMISILDLPRPACVDNDKPSSIGRLDTLPIEVTHAILQEIDFRSLSRFSRTSLQANNVVQSLAAYRDLTCFAPEALAALSETKIISLHSVAKIHAVFKTQNCTSCGEYGAYLYLPTCERCCFQCLKTSPSFAVLPLDLVSERFKLDDELCELPNIHVIPGSYFYGKATESWPRILVNVKMAKELAITVHGSDMVHSLETAYSSNMGMAQDVADFARSIFDDIPGIPNWLEDRASMPASDLDGLLMPESYLDGLRETQVKHRTARHYLGMAAVYFPSLRSAFVVEYGLWCQGCDSACAEFHHLHDPFSDMILGDLTGARWGIERRVARSRSGFLEHARSCRGVKTLLPLGEHI